MFIHSHYSQIIQSCTHVHMYTYTHVGWYWCCVRVCVCVFSSVQQTLLVAPHHIYQLLSPS